MLGSLPPVAESPDGGTGGSAVATSGTGGNGGNGLGGAGGGSTSSTSASAGGAGSTGGSGGAGGCCDCDHDGVLAQGVCGGTDCDDHDSRAHPGQMLYFGTPDADPAVGFDFDCSGVADRNPDLLKTVDCSGLGLPCAAGVGFIGKVAPACGETGQWGSCKQNGLGCVADVIEQNKQMTCK